jgi:ring-1,2-phenylacetyl-CoA epoxidase subunit PaaC
MSATASGDPGAREGMVSFVGALADNKAALGRRYAEWAISAPTLESAVAAAAMAQDELGHARSTYPVLKALGAEPPAPDSFGGSRRLALLDDELPDWSSVIAANLLVDGVLATFVAACVDGTLVPMAQRARKIRQEEGSHRIHAEAWARRLCRAGGGERDRFLARLEHTWVQAGRWAGPDDDAASAAPLSAGMITLGAAQQRALVRDWLIALLGAEGVSIELAEPRDWSRWDPARRRWNP